MRLPIVCTKCLIEDHLASVDPIASVEFRDDGRYEVVCPKGHRATTLLQEQRFELLFEIGAYAIGDGYYREAVSSFAASLERFYEFFILAVLLDNEISSDAIAEAWKYVAPQSERQLGAFIFLYTRQFHRPPALLDSKRTKFRNEVIHKGRIPNRSEALDYGEAVLAIVSPLLKEAKEHLPKGVRKTISEHLSRTRTKEDEGRLVTTTSIGTILSIVRFDALDPTSLEEEIASRMRRRR